MQKEETEKLNFGHRSMKAQQTCKKNKQAQTSPKEQRTFLYDLIFKTQTYEREDFSGERTECSANNSMPWGKLEFRYFVRM